MSTRNLPRHRPSTGRRTGGVTGPAVPPFGLAFPASLGNTPRHPWYELRLAANRVYQARRSAYRTAAAQMDAAELLEFVREDVLARMLEEVPARLGPIRYTRYRWLDQDKFHAWLPFERDRAEALYADFRRKLLNRLVAQDLGRY